MAEIRATEAATSETPYYGALETLLNAVGRTLRPRLIANDLSVTVVGGHGLS